MEQMYLARVKVISVEPVSDESDIQSKGEFASLQKECNLSWRPKTTDASAITVLHSELEVVTARVSDLELENAILRKEIETS